MELLFLHGAIGAGDQLVELSQMFAKQHTIHMLDFSGHGKNAINDAPFSISLFAEEVINYINSKNIDKVSIFGYSMGGYVAMYLAQDFPGRVDKIITLATKFHWDAATAAKEIKMLDADKIAQKVPQFADALDKRHSGIGWKTVLSKTADMMIAMGNNAPLAIEDYAHIPNLVLIMLGDRDKMVSIDETIDVYKALPNAQLCIIPNTAHPIEQLDVAAVASIASRFLAG